MLRAEGACPASLCSTGAATLPGERAPEILAKAIRCHLIHNNDGITKFGQRTEHTDTPLETGAAAIVGGGALRLVLRYDADILC